MEYFKSLYEAVAYCEQQRAIYARAEAEQLAHWQGMQQRDLDDGGGWD